MITAAIGKIFLDAYNEKYDTNYDAKTFFVEVYHPLFFDSNKYLQWVSNSPFVQGLESSKSGEYCVKDIIKDEKGKTKTFKSKEELDIFVEDNYSERKREIVEIQNLCVGNIFGSDVVKNGPHLNTDLLTGKFRQFRVFTGREG